MTAVRYPGHHARRPRSPLEVRAMQTFQALILAEVEAETEAEALGLITDGDWEALGVQSIAAKGSDTGA